MKGLKTKLANNRYLRSMVHHCGVSTALRFHRRIIRKQPRLFILMYHKVAPDAFPYFGGAVSPEAFEHQIQMLVRNFNVIAIEDLENINSYTGTRDTVVITFDDGYQSVYQWAFALLKRYGLPATVFLATDYIGNRRMLWYDYISWLLYKANNTAHFDVSGLPVCTDDLRSELELFFVSKKKDDRIDCLRNICVQLKHLSEINRSDIINCIARHVKAKAPECLQTVMLSWDQILEMSKENIRFGAHTKTHCSLSMCTPEKAYEELSGSKAIIESYLQKPVTTFAYPYGKGEDFSEENIGLVQKCGFKFACTAIRGEEILPLKNAFTLKRRAVSNTPYLFLV